MAEALKDINTAIELASDTADFYRTRAVIHGINNDREAHARDWARYKELEASQAKEEEKK